MMHAAPPALRIRPMAARDIPAVVAIEVGAFTSPWTRDTFRTLLNRDRVVTRVLTTPVGEVVGYAVLWIVLDEAELTNIALRDDYRGRGHGSRLLVTLLEIARARGVRKVHLEVRESNEVARALYHRHGFRVAGRRRDYYTKPREDALVLSKRLDPA